MKKYQTQYTITELIFEFLNKHGDKRMPIRVQNDKERANFALLLRKMGYFLPEGKDIYLGLTPLRGAYKHRFKLFSDKIATFGRISYKEETVTYTSIVEFLSKKLSYTPKINDFVYNEAYGSGRVTLVEGDILTVKFVKKDHKIRLASRDVVIDKREATNIHTRRNFLAEYYYVVGGEVLVTLDTNFYEDHLRFREGNYFNSEEEAEFARDNKLVKGFGEQLTLNKLGNLFYKYNYKMNLDGTLKVDVDFNEEKDKEDFNTFLNKLEEEGN